MANDVIDDKVTKDVADLIKINIEDASLHRFTEMLKTALDPAKDLGELDTTDIDVLSHPTGLETEGYEDEIEPGLAVTDALANAKRNKREAFGYIKVPRVIDN